MEDTTTKVTNGKTKLPPLSATSKTEGGGTAKKKVVKKKKKPVVEGESAADDASKKPTPRRRKTTASENSTGGDGGETAATPKKKKRSPRKTTESEADPASARSAGSQGEDVTGSKASLISKGTKTGTPRKKRVKKKVKKTSAPGDGPDEYLDSTLVADLTDIQEDIVTDAKTKDRDYDRAPYSTESVVLKSQPTEKFFIETDRGFKGENKMKFAKRAAEEEAEKAIVKEEPKKTTMAFALSTHKVLKTFFLFCHGLLAGFAAWHIVMTYTLLDFQYQDFLQHYFGLAMPVQSIFYVLLVLCTVSTFDRFDISNVNRRFLLRALTLQNGTIAVLLYFVALVISVSNIALEDKINLYELQPSLWNSTTQQAADDDLRLWSSLNTTRGALVILGWFVMALTPMTDRLTDNLSKTGDNLIGDGLEGSSPV